MKTQFIIKKVEMDISRCRYDPNMGTILDPSLPRKYEYRVYEVGSDGYIGLAGQFKTRKEAKQFINK